MRGWALPILILVAGCVSPDPAAEDAPPPATASPLPADAGDGAASAPTHPVGRAWTYAGRQQYNPEPEWTVVVAQADGQGYLFGGKTPEDLVYEALWENPLYGRRTHDLNREGWERAPLRFPLSEGASWSYSDSITLVARRASVATPSGVEDGFAIEGANDRVALRWDYAPSLGQVVLQQSVGADGTVYDDYRMTAVADGVPALWYDRTEIQAASDPHEPASLEVRAGYDHVIASAGGTAGARAAVEGPGGATWTTEFTGAEEWHHMMLPATEGRWIGLALGRPFVPGAPDPGLEGPMGWSYMHLAAVRWLDV